MCDCRFIIGPKNVIERDGLKDHYTGAGLTTFMGMIKSQRNWPRE